MGTVLLPAATDGLVMKRRGFSPLLDGDGVASEWRDRRWSDGVFVSVPFSMGTVLLPSHHIGNRHFRRVSVPFSMGTVLLH